MSKEKQQYAVQMRDITKSFGSYTVLNGACLEVQNGEIHALVGQNGAGKTTLMNILYGLQQADSGEVLINGEPVKIRSASKAIKYGIGMVHQHFMLIDNFTVAENIILGSENTKAFGIMDNRVTNNRLQDVVERYNLNIDLGAKVDNITVGMQQKVEIMKLLYKGADILIFDEPTAILNPEEIKEFEGILKNLAREGKTIILITHKLREVKNLADRCTVLKDGKTEQTFDIEDKSLKEITELVTKDMTGITVKELSEPGETIVCRIRKLSVKNDEGLLKVDNLTLRVHEGEVVGIVGYDGNGQTELTDALIGIRKCCGGKIAVNRKEIQNKSPRAIRKSGVSIIHEDRMKRGLVQSFTVKENAVIEKYRTSEFSKLGVINEDKMTEFAERVIEKYRIEPADCLNSPASALSGGNQQKLIVARELENDSDFIVASQPTKGMDIGSFNFIHDLLIKEKNKGKAILLISNSAQEVMELSDIVYVMYDGKFVASFDRCDFDRKTIEEYMSGGKRDAIFE